MESNGAFHRHLREELAKRMGRNSRYSLRAFAKHLGVGPSTLSQILNQKRSLSDKMCEKLAAPLGLSPHRMRHLMQREPGPLPDAASAFPNFLKIEEDRFHFITDWYYYTILELTRVEDFKPKISWIANRLGIRPAVARSAVMRLKRLGYLITNERGEWQDALGNATNLGNVRTAAAYREHQKQILNKAGDALRTIPYEKRVQSSMILTGSRERVVEAKRRILAFIEELHEFMKTGDTLDEVYALSVSLFPLSAAPAESGKGGGGRLDH